MKARTKTFGKNIGIKTIFSMEFTKLKEYKLVTVDGYI